VPPAKCCSSPILAVDRSSQHEPLTPYEVVSGSDQQHERLGGRESFEPVRNLAQFSHKPCPLGGNRLVRIVRLVHAPADTAGGTGLASGRGGWGSSVARRAAT